jgi:hypothetical protein
MTGSAAMRTARPFIVVLLMAIGAGAQAASTVPDDLVLADVTACKKPRLAPPPPMKETYERYHFQRRYIDLDGSGTCVLMEAWVERLSGSDSPGMRTRMLRFLRAGGKKWVRFYTDLQLFPFLLRSPSTGEAWLVVAPDHDFDSALGSVFSEAYVRGGWQMNDPSGAPGTPVYTLLPVGEGKGHILRALAAQLAQRTPPDRQTPAERERIHALQFEAAEADRTSPQTPRP